MGSWKKSTTVEILSDIAELLEVTVDYLLNCFGVTPVVFRANIVCGNKSHEQIGIMAQAFKEICEEQGGDQHSICKSDAGTKSNHGNG